MHSAKRSCLPNVSALWDRFFIISVFCVTGAIRIYLFGSHMQHIGLYCAVGLIGYELLVFRAYRPRNNWSWLGSTVMWRELMSKEAEAKERIVQEHHELRRDCVSKGGTFDTTLLIIKVSVLAAE